MTVKTQFSAHFPVRTRSASATRDPWVLFHDLYASVKSSGSWLYSAWIEVLLSYRNTVLGPLWILVGTGLFVFAVGALYGQVLMHGGTNYYMVHLAVGIVIWYLVTQGIVEACYIFVSDKAALLDGESSPTDLILKKMAKNLIYFLHNVLVIIAVFFYTGATLSWGALALIVTIPLLVATLLWSSVILSILGARYPDLGEIIHSVLRLGFFLTPILWVPHQAIKGGFIDAALYLNPFYYLIEIVREPLINGRIPTFELAVVAIALPVGWLLASLLYARTKQSVALWL